MNNCTFVGKVESLPYIRDVQGETKKRMCTFVLKTFGKNLCIIDAVAWNSLAEYIGHNISQGDTVSVSGYLKIIRDGSDAGYRQSTEVVCTRVEAVS